MKILLGIDFGTRRIGLALSDGLGLLAHPAGTLDGLSESESVRRICELITRESVAEIIIGMPFHMNGSRGTLADDVERFGSALANKSGLACHYWDERLSSAAAGWLLNETGTRGKKRRAAMDAVAACVILQSYLDHLKLPPPSKECKSTDE